MSAKHIDFEKLQDAFVRYILVPNMRKQQQQFLELMIYGSSDIKIKRTSFNVVDKLKDLITLESDRKQLNAEYLQAQDETHRDVIAEAVVEVDRKIKELKNQLQ